MNGASANGVSVQIQTVLYKMDHASIFRAFDSVANALRVNHEHPEAPQVGRITIVHGDASPEPTFTPEQVEDIQRRYGDAFTYVYRYFNENTGTSRGHNLMFEDCDSDYLVVQNPDIQYAPRFFERMLEPFSRTDRRVGLVEARQVPIQHPKTYDELTGETPWSTGACFMIASSVYREIGGFDAGLFFMYCDDVDLSWRVRLAGYTIIFQPLAPVYHPKYLSNTGGWQSTDAEAYYSREAMLFMCYKWSYDKRLETLLRDFLASDDKISQKAAQSFIKRRDAGNLPAQLDPHHKVADINDNGYATLRFFM